MDDEVKCLTVSELIERLRQFDGSLLVITEGCDCWGEAADVDTVENLFNDGLLVVRITRS